MKRSQADDTSQNTLSEKCIFLHNEDTFDQFCSKDTFPLRLISFSDGQFIPETFGPVNWIFSTSVYPLELGLIFTKILAHPSRSFLEWCWGLAFHQRCRQSILPRFPTPRTWTDITIVTVPGLGLRDCLGDSCVYEAHRGNRMAEHT